LAKIHRAASDVTAYQVGVRRFKLRGRKDPARQNAPAEPGSKALNLIFQLLQHVHFDLGQSGVLNHDFEQQRKVGCDLAFLPKVKDGRVQCGTDARECGF
jgi:hypothetical protein